MHWLASLFILVMSAAIYQYLNGVQYNLQPRYYMEESKRLRGVQFCMILFFVICAIDLVGRLPYFTVTVY